MAMVNPQTVHRATFLAPRHRCVIDLVSSRFQGSRCACVLADRRKDRARSVEGSLCPRLHPRDQ